MKLAASQLFRDLALRANHRLAEQDTTKGNAGLPSTFCHFVAASVLVFVTACVAAFVALCIPFSLACVPVLAAGAGRSDKDI